MHRVASENPDPAMSSSRRSGKVCRKFLAPLRVAARDSLPGRTGLPDAQAPDPVKPTLRQAVQVGVRHVIQRGCPVQGTAQFCQPHAY